MIEDFIASWPLFHSSWLAGWILVVLLSMSGVLVVARDQIFIGAAVAEASTLGIAFGMWLTTAGPFHGVEWMESDAFLSALAGGFSVLAAFVTVRGGSAGRETNEAITGWVFLAAASLAILLVSHSPHGTEEVHRLLSSSIIGTSETEVWILAGLTTVLAGGMLAFRGRILLVLTDPDMAQASGIRARSWDITLCCLLGLTVGLSLRISGMLYTFGCLVLPSLAARNFCRNARSVFIAAPVAGLLTCAVAFVLANHHDQPPGQMAVAAMCGAAALASLGRRVWRRTWRRG